MVNIQIKQLRLENFKCHKALTLDFNGGNASIYGDNATGKTSIYDALTWLLFGKDSQGNGEKNIEIKPLDANGEVRDHDALTVVEAVLLIDGEETSLRRTYREVWSTKRGSSQATYDGNTSEYYINGVPCKRNAFQEQVNELVSEDTFRMLTSVSHFASGLSWQDRRAVLFKATGVMDDKQILATSDQFIPLVESMGRLSLEDYKKKLLSEKRGFVGAKTEIPARISECQKTISDLEGVDFVGARADSEALNSRKEALDAQLLGLEQDSALENKRMEIREARLELSSLENENKAFRASQSAPTMNVRVLNDQLTRMSVQLSGKRRELARESDLISGYNKMIADARNAWMDENAKQFTGGNCPTCGQQLPADKLQKSRDAFEGQKRSRLRDIEERADFYKKARQGAEERLEGLQEEIRQLEEDMQVTRQQIADAEALVVQIVDMDGFTERKAAVEARIDILSNELADMANKTIDVRGDLTRQIAGIKLEIAQKQRILGQESMLDYARERIEQLRQEAKNGAECLEAIEKMLWLMEEFTRYKTRFVEDSINGMFRIARFRLFREQANGGIEDRCDVVYDGVPYMGLNNGMKINVGIDIINTLSGAYGVTVPLFVDNAESVTRLEGTAAQMIRLVVSEQDKELRVNYEN